MAEKRTVIQIFWAALSNGYLAGFRHGRLYDGALKSFCMPGLNCYSCPGALGACPLGSLQSSLATKSGVVYVVGWLFLFGALMGRLVCGWLCPFGLVQEALHKIPLGRKWKRLPGDRILVWLKYVLLALFVILLPLFAVDAFGLGTTWFCKYVCPQGTLEAGVPLALVDSALRSSLGFLYRWKVTILIVVIVFSVFVYRPFCRYVCPLGAVYGFFNKVSLYRFEVDETRCVHCDACRKACPMDLSVWKDPNQMLCIRCGKCKSACPTGAITSGWISRPVRKKNPQRLHVSNS
ncbi:MAG: 4Fe-4S binding protein [Sphaerochaetaceae bacterium]